MYYHVNSDSTLVKKLLLYVWKNEFKTRNCSLLLLNIWIMNLQSISAQHNGNTLVSYDIGVKANSAHNGLL